MEKRKMSDLITLEQNKEMFQKSRFGMFIHWGIYALGARHEWLKNHEEMSDEKYQRYFDLFSPDLYEPEKWADAAASAGMKYFVITTKHHDGFCLWDSQYTDYKAPNTPCGKDLLTPMVDAFRSRGLKVGFYYSLIDWHHPNFTIDMRHSQRNHPDKEELNKGRDFKKYAEYMRNQVTELLTNFGRIDIMWFDFSYPGPDGKGKDDWESEKLLELVKSKQPHIMVNNRLDLPGNGAFVTPEQFQPPAGYTDEDGNPALWEACQTFSGSWGYHRDETNWKSVETLLWMLIDSVSKGGNMLLNVGPTARGEFDFRAMDRLEGMGQWMRYNSRSIHGCGASEFTPPSNCTYTQNGDRLYLHIFSWPFKKLYLPGLAHKIRYAQFLHDNSEIFFLEEDTISTHSNLSCPVPENSAAIELPAQKPPVTIPVVELILK